MHLSVRRMAGSKASEVFARFASKAKEEVVHYAQNDFLRGVNAGRSLVEPVIRDKAPAVLNAVNPINKYREISKGLKTSNDPSALTTKKADGIWESGKSPVTWPGHADHRTCMVDKGAIAKAFSTWNAFSYFEEMAPEFSKIGSSTARRDYVIPDENLTEAGRMQQKVMRAMNKQA